MVKAEVERCKAAPRLCNTLLSSASRKPLSAKKIDGVAENCELANEYKPEQCRLSCIMNIHYASIEGTPYCHTPHSPSLVKKKAKAECYDEKEKQLENVFGHMAIF